MFLEATLRGPPSLSNLMRGIRGCGFGGRTPQHGTDGWTGFDSPSPSLTRSPATPVLGCRRRFPRGAADSNRS